MGINSSRLLCTKCKVKVAENRYQICATCRTRNCEKCGKKMLAKSAYETKCHPCREYYRKKNRSRPSRTTEYEDYIL